MDSHANSGRLLKVPVYLLAAVIIASASGTALATPTDITSMASLVQRGLYYQAAPQQWTWTSRIVSGGTINTEMGFIYFFDGTVDWISDLDQDISVGGQAEATFLPNGSITLTGTLKDMFMTPLFTGELFTADVSAFHLRETLADTNNFETIGDVRISPTGGYLVNGVGNVYAHLATDYQFGLQFAAGLSENGGPLPVEDFSFDIWGTAGAEWAMVQVPEPVTALFMVPALCGLVILRRRQ
jgi:hypothetical protein